MLNFQAEIESWDTFLLSFQILLGEGKDCARQWLWSQIGLGPSPSSTTY